MILICPFYVGAFVLQVTIMMYAHGWNTILLHLLKCILKYVKNKLKPAKNFLAFEIFIG